MEKLPTISGIFPASMTMFTLDGDIDEVGTARHVEYLIRNSAHGWYHRLMVDCHGRLNSASARRLCEALVDLDLLFIEEPIPPENVEAVCQV